MIEVTIESTDVLTRITIWPTGKAESASRIDVVDAAGTLEIVARLTVPVNTTASIARTLATALNMAAEIVERRIHKQWPDEIKKVVREFYRSLRK